MAFLNFLENVRACILDINKIHSSISFNTPSDALVSSLFIKYTDATGMPLSLFDDLLTLFRHADFHADGVTFHTSEDILDRIAAERRIITNDRATPRGHEPQQNAETHPAMRTQPSSVIVELLAEYIESQRVPFHQSCQIDDDYFYRPVGWEVDHELEKMCLVHRSWTDVVRRYLRRRINIVGQKGLRHLLQNPQIGPWVRELSFSGRTTDSNYAHISTKELPRLLCDILERCPNVTHFYLSNFNLGYAPGFVDGDLDKTVDDVMKQISSMKFLEYLGMRNAHSSTKGRQDLGKLCTILPNLRSLKSLSLERSDSMYKGGERNTDANEPAKFLASLNAARPPPMLKTVSLISLDIVTSGIWTWLLDSLTDITRLGIFMNQLVMRRVLADGERELVYLRPSLQTKMANVTDLQLVQCSDLEDVLFLLQFFPSLQTLSMNSESWRTLPSASAVFPHTIRSLHFHLPSIPKKNQDPIAHGLLMSNPHIRKMTITYSTYEGRAYPTRRVFHATTRYCERNRIGFNIYGLHGDAYMETLPHLLDLEIHNDPTKTQFS